MTENCKQYKVCDGGNAKIETCPSQVSYVVKSTVYAGALKKS